MGSIMRDEVSEHSSGCHIKSSKILWVPIMPGTQILWVPDFFFLNSWTFHNFLFFTYYGFKRMEEEQELFIQYGKNMYAAGIEPSCDFKMKDQQSST
jgi:hypothetical protein